MHNASSLKWPALTRAGLLLFSGAVIRAIDDKASKAARRIGQGLLAGFDRATATGARKSH